MRKEDKEKTTKMFEGEPKSSEGIYCRYCRKIVTKAVKEYRGGNGKEYADPRNVCSGGCNTDWRDLVGWHIKKIEVEKINKSRK